MEKNIKACIDRFVDPLTYSSNGRNIMSSVQPARLFISISKKWPKKNLKVQFLEGKVEQKEMVRKYAVDWTKQANLNFDFNVENGSRAVGIYVVNSTSSVIIFQEFKIGKNVSYPCIFSNISCLYQNRYKKLLNEDMLMQLNLFQ